jgi:hypothetical protein
MAPAPQPSIVLGANEASQTEDSDPTTVVSSAQEERRLIFAMNLCGTTDGYVVAQQLNSHAI